MFPRSLLGQRALRDYQGDARLVSTLRIMKR